VTSGEVIPEERKRVGSKKKEGLTAADSTILSHHTRRNIEMGHCRASIRTRLGNRKRKPSYEGYEEEKKGKRGIAKKAQVQIDQQKRVLC